MHDDMDDLAATLARRTISHNFAPPAFVLKTPDPVNDGSSYNAIAFPTESFNDADRTIVTNPADRPGSPFGWHDTDGVAGPEFTTTQGNNAHAYMDQDDNNQPDFNSSPDGGATLTFDFPIDRNEHAQNYRAAATTNLFYANNMIHDLLHRYGFDEASGNFQANNYGRGGTGGDYVRAEAADGNGTNNAMFGTPVNDGGTPADADVPVAGEPVRLAEQRHRRRRRHLQRVVVAVHARAHAGRAARQRARLRRHRLRGAISIRPRCRRAPGSPSSTAARPRRSARTCSARRSPRRSAPRRS